MTPDLSWLLQRRCRTISIDVSGAYFDFEGASLTLECPWRIMARGRIMLGSVDHAQKFGHDTPVDAAATAASILGDRKIQYVQVLPNSSDLVLDFGNGLRLEAWNNSSGYEGWTAHGPDNQRIVALGGGEVAIWKA